MRAGLEMSDDPCSDEYVTKGSNLGIISDIQTTHGLQLKSIVNSRDKS